MDRRSQPAMRVGSSGAARRGRAAPQGAELDEATHGGGAARPAPEEHPHHDYRVLTRSWAVTRLVGLVVVCGLGVAACVAIFFLLLSVAIDQV